MRRASPGRTTKLGRTPWRAWFGLTRPGTRYTRFGSASDWMFLVISLSTRGLAGAGGAARAGFAGAGAGTAPAGGPAPPPNPPPRGGLRGAGAGTARTAAWPPPVNVSAGAAGRVGAKVCPTSNIPTPTATSRNVPKAQRSTGRRRLLRDLLRPRAQVSPG